MAVFNKFNAFVQAVAHKEHDLANDTLMVALTNEAPVADNAFFGDIDEIAGGNGYDSGGVQAEQISSGQTAGLYRLACDDVVFTATGPIGPFRYAVLYNADHISPGGNEGLIGFWDYGVSLILGNGETFTVDFDQVSGVLTIQ